jgi:membrane protease YdiL (CAAX protease family)
VEERAAPDPLTRYRALQVISILLIAIGLAASVAVVVVNQGQGGSTCEPPVQSTAMALDQAMTQLLVLVVGGLALIVGLILNATRAIIVRASLPASRYRGPAIMVLYLIATIVATVGSLFAAGDLVALVCGGRASVGGTLLVLTITQVGLTATAFGLVALPNGLQGVRLLPARGLGRSMLIGLALAVPAWVAAQLAGVLVMRLLELVNVRPAEGIADAAVSRADPTVLILALVLVAPVAEEIFFRGLVYNAWEREYGAMRAVWGSALLFAVIHGSLFALVPIFGLGIALALLYRATRSLPATIVLHASFNAITVTLALLARAGILDLPT